MLLFIMMFLVLVFWVISILFNDIEDELQYRYTVSIFDWIKKTSWWSWYMIDPDDAWERKYNEDGKRKKWLGFIIKPAFVFDGWHGAKILRQFFQYLTVFTGIVVGYLLPSILLWCVFVGGFVSFAILNYYSHNTWFFDGMLLKDWWNKRPNKKEWLLKKIG
jgi:hypothetical protein